MSSKHADRLEIEASPPSYPAPVRYPSPPHSPHSEHHHHHHDYDHCCDHPRTHSHWPPRAAAPYAPPAWPGVYGVGGMVLCYPPTDNFCPATGGPHIVRRRQGCVSIFLSVVTFPIGLVALPFDRKVACRKCGFVLREAWGNC